MLEEHLSKHQIRLGLNLMLFLSTLNIGISQNCTSDSNQKFEAKIDSIFQSYASKNSPGLALGVIKDGRLDIARYYGTANLEHAIPIGPETVFSLASVSKQFTVLGILLLEQEGKLSLEDNVHKYIPELPDFGYELTIRQMANNTSGLRDCLQLLGQAGYISDNIILKQTVMQMIMRQKELNFEPGTEFSYSNTGFVLLAEVIERITNQTFPVFVKERILDPLGMEHTFVMNSYNKIVKNRASSYERESNQFLFAPVNYTLYGSTGIYTTLPDMAKWAINFQKPKVGNANLFHKMNALNKLKNGQTFGYALGQFNRPFHGKEFIYHSGGDGGYVAFLGRFPKEKISVILLGNTNGIFAEGKSREVVELLVEQPINKSLNKLPREMAQKSKKVPATSKQLKSYEGSYLGSKNFLVRKLEVLNDSLFYIRPEQGNRRSFLNPLTEDTFQLGDYTNMLLKIKNQPGNGKRMEFILDGQIDEIFESFIPSNYGKMKLSSYQGKYESEELGVQYELRLLNDKLIVVNDKLGHIELNQLSEDTFLASTWQFQFVGFTRDNTNKIIGFGITSENSRNVWFEKIN